MPEMSVVRFTESDVIVASVYLRDWTNNKALDGQIFENGQVVYNHVDGQGGVDKFTPIYGDNPVFYYDPTNYHGYDLSTLMQMDGTESASSDTNVWYRWRDGAFYRVSQ